MRRPILPLVIVATVFLAPVSMQAKPSWVKKAQDLGFKDIQNCQACHTAKPPAMGDLGKWLRSEETRRKASTIDLAWIKDYVKP